MSLPWTMEQLGKLHATQPERVNRAIERLLEEDKDLRWSLVVIAYQDEEVNLGKAAELLGLPELELRSRFRELGIPLRIGPADAAAARAEVEAFEAWSSPADGDDLGS